MKCFEVTESCVANGIAITATPYPHVGIGEEGRGRTYTRFPVARRFFESLGENAHVERASVLKTKEKGTLLLVEEKDPADRRALVLVDIAAGYRGWTEWTGANRQEVPCPRRGWRSYIDYFCRECGAEYENESERSRIHPDSGTVWVYDPFPSPGTIVLAEGYRAQGDAGRMGGHMVRLLIMEPGAIFRVLRHGRLYGAPAPRYVAWDGETLRLGTRDEIFPPSEESEEGEVI